MYERNDCGLCGGMGRPENEISIRKHGISFAAAALVFADEERIEYLDAVHSAEEDRYIVLGMVHKVLFVVYTDRGDASRLISARLATPREMRIYFDDEGQQPILEQISEIEAAARREPMPDGDAPELTEAQYAQTAQIARTRRAEQKKLVVAIRISPETLAKAKATGKGYTSFLSRLIDSAINDPALVRKSL